MEITNPIKRQIRIVQRAAEVLGWSYTCEIVGRGGISGAYQKDLDRLVRIAREVNPDRMNAPILY